MSKWKQGTPVFWDVAFIGGIVIFLSVVGYKLYALWEATHHVGVRLI